MYLYEIAKPNNYTLPQAIAVVAYSTAYEKIVEYAKKGKNIDTNLILKLDQAVKNTILSAALIGE